MGAGAHRIGPGEDPRGPQLSESSAAESRLDRCSAECARRAPSPLGGRGSCATAVAMRSARARPRREGLLRSRPRGRPHQRSWNEQWCCIPPPRYLRFAGAPPALPHLRTTPRMQPTLARSRSVAIAHVGLAFKLMSGRYAVAHTAARATDHIGCGRAAYGYRGVVERARAAL